jgi:hypothetical protein
MSHSPIRFLVLVTALLAGGAANATNLVVNGDFAAPATGSGWTQRASIPGWTSDTGDRIEVGNSAVYRASCFTAACQVLEVNANRFGSVSQTVSGLQAGRSYALSWAYAGRVNGGPQRLDVLLDGNNVGQQFSSSFTGWLESSYRFVASANTTRLTFASSNVGGRPSYGNLVTAVSVAGVPEPASWAMLIIGFGMVGATLRRRSGRLGQVTA